MQSAIPNNNQLSHATSHAQIADADSPPPYSQHPNPDTDHASHFRENSVRIGDIQAQRRSVLSRVPNFLLPFLNFSVMGATVAACEKAGLPTAVKAAVFIGVGTAIYKMTQDRIREIEEDELQALIEDEINRRMPAEQ